MTPSSDGVILANGDTVHPVSVEKTLLAARGDGKKIILALDTVKKLADEEMKVVVDPEQGRPEDHQADGPGRGHRRVHRRHPHRGRRRRRAGRRAEDRLRDATPQQFYEDGYQELVNRGFTDRRRAHRRRQWVEIDNHDDLAKGREIACQY